MFYHVTDFSYESDAIRVFCSPALGKVLVDNENDEGITELLRFFLGQEDIHGADEKMISNFFVNYRKMPTLSVCSREIYDGAGGISIREFKTFDSFLRSSEFPWIFFERFKKHLSELAPSSHVPLAHASGQRKHTLSKWSI